MKIKKKYIYCSNILANLKRPITLYTCGIWIIYLIICLWPYLRFQKNVPWLFSPVTKLLRVKWIRNFIKKKNTTKIHDKTLIERWPCAVYVYVPQISVRINEDSKKKYQKLIPHNCCVFNPELEHVIDDKPSRWKNVSNTGITCSHLVGLDRYIIYSVITVHYKNKNKNCNLKRMIENNNVT